VKNPTSIPVTRRTGVSRAGRAGRKSAHSSEKVGQRDARGKFRRQARTATVIISIATQIRAGTMPASSSWMIDTFVIEP
jgi:hypothetical protein